MNISIESSRLAPEVQEAVAVFLKNYKPGDGPFAISEAMAAVRQTFPVANLSDNDLTAAIAEQAISASLNIHFDGAGKLMTISATERWEDEGGAIRS